MTRKIFLLLLSFSLLCFPSCDKICEDLALPDLIPKILGTATKVTIGETVEWDVLTCNLYEDIADSCGILDAAGSVTNFVVAFFEMPISTGIELLSKLIQNGKISPNDLVSTNACPFDRVGILFGDKGTYCLQEEVDIAEEVTERSEGNNGEDTDVEAGLNENNAESRSAAIKVSSAIDLKRFKEIFEGPYSQEFIDAFNRSQVIVHITDTENVEEVGTVIEQLGSKTIYIVKAK